MTGTADVAADLVAEQQALDAVVSVLSEEQWLRPTASPGWQVIDQIAHLSYFDEAAALAIDDPDAFRTAAADLIASLDQTTSALGAGRTPDEVLASWRQARRRLTASVVGLAHDARIPWYGPSMGAKSFLTARLMECWAHGQDVCDAVGVEHVADDRIRHVAHLGYITRGWTYVNRGLDVPTATIRLELSAPSGDTWRFGPEDADELVDGSAVDFCLVVTQRRHLDDTGLRVPGEAARDWLLKAQAFAGQATDPPSPGGGPAPQV